ncbi:hypothetical protein EMCRGX_G002921 [Ephydatia muelleri]
MVCLGTRLGGRKKVGEEEKRRLSSHQNTICQRNRIRSVSSIHCVLRNTDLNFLITRWLVMGKDKFQLERHRKNEHVTTSLDPEQQQVMYPVQ